MQHAPHPPSTIGHEGEHAVVLSAVVEPEAAQPRSSIPAPVSVAIVGTFLILLIGALFYARSFFLPLTLALLMALTLSPLVQYFSRRGIPAWVTAIVLVFGMGAGFVALSAFLSEPISQMIAEAPNVADKVRERFAFLQEPLAMISSASEQLEHLADGGSSGTGTTNPNEPQRVVLVQSGMLSWAAGTVADIGTTLFATFILALFLLASSDMLRLKLIRVLPALSGKKRSLRVLRDIENEVSRYLLTITAINAGLGACVGIGMYLSGMPNPLLWAVAAMLLNYIPFVGAFVGMVLSAAVALVTFPTLGMAAIPPLIYLGCQIVESNFVTPMIVGRRLELNTVAILIFLALTTWMWGIVGTIIGVPILVVVKVFCDNFPALSGLGEFLSAQTVTPPAEEETEAQTTTTAV
jgi:predicted PurR-regulated permease PerM